MLFGLIAGSTSAARPMPIRPPRPINSTDSTITRVSTVLSLKPARLQRGQFGHALAHRLRHRVAGQQQQGEEHRAHDRGDDHADVGELLGEGLLERGFGFALGFVIGIRRDRIDGLRHPRRVVGIVQRHRVPAHLVLDVVVGFIEVLPVHHQLAFFVGGQCTVLGAVDALQFQRPVVAAAAREDRGLQRDGVTDLPAELLGQGFADDGAGAGLLPVFQLRRVDLQFAVHVEVVGRHREVREEVLRILVDAAEPTCRRPHHARQATWRITQVSKADPAATG